MKLRLMLKRFVQGLALVLVRGKLGSFYRAAFYKLTLQDCSIDSAIALGCFFSRRRAIIGRYVSIDSYCVIGQAQIGARTQIPSHVEIPGARPHARDSQ